MRCRGLTCRFSPPAAPPTSARVCFRPRFGRPACRLPSCRSARPRSTRSVGSSSRAGHLVRGAGFWRAPAPVPCRRGESTPPAFPSTPPRAPGTVPLAVRSHPDWCPCLLRASSLPLPPPLSPPVYRKDAGVPATDKVPRLSAPRCFCARLRTADDLCRSVTLVGGTRACAAATRRRWSSDG